MLLLGLAFLVLIGVVIAAAVAQGAKDGTGTSEPGSQSTTAAQGYLDPRTLSSALMQRLNAPYGGADPAQDVNCVPAPGDYRFYCSVLWNNNYVNYLVTVTSDGAHYRYVQANNP